jgi:hypothetical protein
MGKRCTVGNRTWASQLVAIPMELYSSHSVQLNNNNYCYTWGYCKTVIGREWETSASDPMTEPLNGESAVYEATRDRNLLKWSSGESASQAGQKASLHKHLSSRGFRHSVPPYKSLVHVAFRTFTIHNKMPCLPVHYEPRCWRVNVSSVSNQLPYTVLIRFTLDSNANRT